jgi:hypothetical protein
MPLKSNGTLLSCSANVAIPKENSQLYALPTEVLHTAPGYSAHSWFQPRQSLSGIGLNREA